MILTQPKIGKEKYFLPINEFTLNFVSIVKEYTGCDVNIISATELYDDSVRIRKNEVELAEQRGYPFAQRHFH